MHFSTSSLLICFITVFLVRNTNAAEESLIDKWICRPVVPKIEDALKGKCTCQGQLSLKTFSFNLDAACDVPVGSSATGKLTAAITGRKADVGMAVTTIVSGNSYNAAFTMTYERKQFNWTPTTCTITLNGTTCTKCTVGDKGFPWPGYTCDCSNVGYNGNCSDFQPQM